MKKYFIYFLLLFSVSLSLPASANQTEADSLKTILKTCTNDSLKIQLFHQLYLSTDSVNYSFSALELAQKIKFKRGAALSLLDIGRYYYFNGKEDISLSYLIRAVKIAEEINEKKVLVSGYRYIGYIYRKQDSFMAEDYYNKSLRIAKEINDEISESYIYSALGNIYEGIFEGASESNKKALEYYLKSLEIRERKGSYAEIASSLNETSRVYDLLGMFDKGLQLRLRGLEIAEKSGSTENIIYLCDVLGNDYSLRLHDYKKGLDYQLRAYTIGKTQKNNFEIMFDITKGVAYSYYSLGDYKRSSEFFLQSIILNDSIKARVKKNDYSLSEMKHDMEKELQKEKLLLKDSEIFKVKAEAEKQTTIRNAFLIGFAITLILMIFIYRGNRQKQRLNQTLGIKNKKIENAYRTLAISENKFKLITETINDVFYLYNIVEKKYEYISPNCFSLLGLDQQHFYDGKSSKINIHKDDLASVIEANIKIDSGIPYDIEYRIIIDHRIKWIAEKSSPIFDENGKLIRNSGICRDITKRKIIEETLVKKNKDITDSILYARTIQDAILVPKETIAKKLNEFFILSLPKDIVSGDFYFYKETKNGIIMAVADCTGHGVPAGFLSMIGNAFLNEIVTVNEIITPASILDQLRELIIGSLNQNTTDSESKDGMDIALLLFEKDNSSVQFAGAFNPFYIIRNGEVIEIKADMFPIGIHIVETPEPFTNNKIELQKGDSLYIFSDGYSDQFGGPNGKKFMKNKMKELLLSIQDKKMTEQEKILKQSFYQWKGSLEQVDDILVIGIKI
ncbi:MAG: SpoIIE family protein phosphatase [Bacteroidia bacterium]